MVLLRANAAWYGPMAFRFDKFTIKAQAVQRAVDLAADRGNPQTTPVHLLFALVAEQEGIVRPLLEKIGVDRAALNESLKQNFHICRRLLVDHSPNRTRSSSRFLRLRRLSQGR